MQHHIIIWYGDKKNMLQKNLNLRRVKIIKIKKTKIK